MTHAQLAVAAVNSIGRDPVLRSTYQDPSDICARLVAGALADHFEAEAHTLHLIWPEQSARYQNAADELGAVAVYEDADTIAEHQMDVERYEERA